MNKTLQKSVLLTGPSASGKTTLQCCLTLHFRLIPIPVHSTRELRPNEVQGVDLYHLPKDAYFKNFKKDLYLEESTEAAFFGEAYYGTPTKWITETEQGHFNCFVCPTVKVAKLVKNRLGDRIFWIHLTASEEVRQQRISRRNPEMAKENVSARLSRGSQKIDISGHDYCIDTSYLGAYAIFQRAVKNIHLDRDVSNHRYLCVEL